MNLTKKRKTSIAKHLLNISTMGMLELNDFDRHLQEVKHDMDSVIWKWVNKGAIEQMSILNDIDIKTGGAMAVASELVEGEV